jgi:antitoxin (DNA-binding transcriptional repressor) of toxin-antitoxin stability system
MTLTQHGKPVAQLGPVELEAKPNVRRAVKDMLAFRDQQKCTLGGITVGELIEEGRR